MKILIAEDNFTCRGVLKGVLRKSGHEVVETLDGSEAWQALQQPDPPKLLILDWLMPGMDGPEVVRRVRALDTDRPPYIIMLTTNGEKDHIIAGLSAGANDYLIKPFDPDELIVRVEAGERMIEMQLRQHRQRENAQRFRVKAHQIMDEMQDTLTAKTEELRRAKAEALALETRLQAASADRGRISRDLEESFSQHLTAMQIDLIAIDRQLRSAHAPDPEALNRKIMGLLRLVESLTEQTQIIRASLMIV